MRMLTFREKIGRPECPYLIRWCINLWLFSIRLHHWISSDDQRYAHDHPWWFITIVLRGGYTDVTEHSEEDLPAGSVRIRRALHLHKVRVWPGGCWSILITGRQRRRWGFQVGKKWKKSNKYFLEHGTHPCE